MSVFSIIFIALAMSTDAFVAAIGKGAALQRPCWSTAVKTGLIFGAVETVTPLIGWSIGQAAVQFVAAWDHWLAFGVLSLLGLHMIHEGLSPEKSRTSVKLKQHTFWVLVITAIATSIDALAVGLGLAFVEVNIIVTALAIGLATLIMATLGIMLGRIINTAFGKKAEIVGGLVLILVGASILYDHIGG